MIIFIVVPAGYIGFARGSVRQRFRIPNNPAGIDPFGGGSGSKGGRGVANG